MSHSQCLQIYKTQRKHFDLLHSYIDKRQRELVISFRFWDFNFCLNKVFVFDGFLKNVTRTNSLNFNL